MSGCCFDCGSSLIRDKRWKDIERRTERVQTLDFYETRPPPDHPFDGEVVKSVLVFLPVQDLFLSAIRVCRFWFAVAHSETFFRNYYFHTFKTRTFPRWRGINLKKVFIKEHFLYKNMSGIGEYRFSNRFSFNVYILGVEGSGKTSFLSVVENGVNEGGEYVFGKGAEDDEPVVLKINERPDLIKIPKELRKGGMEFNFFGKEKVEHISFKLLEDEMFFLLVDKTNHNSFAETLFACIRIKYEITNSFIVLIETKINMEEEKNVEDEEVLDLVDRKLVNRYGFIDYHLKMNMDEISREDIQNIMTECVVKLVSRNYPPTRILEEDDVDDILFE